MAEKIGAGGEPQKYDKKDGKYLSKDVQSMSSSELSESLKIDLSNKIKELTNKSVQELQESQAFSIDAGTVGQQIVEYVRSLRNGNEVPKLIIIGKVSKKEKAKIEELTGEELSAINHTLHIDEFRHIEKRHGEKGKSDHSMAELDAYKNIPNVLHGFDSIDYVYDKSGNIATSKRYKDKHGKQAPLIKYIKRIDGKACYVVEAVTDCKRGDISIITAYRQ